MLKKNATISIRINSKLLEILRLKKISPQELFDKALKEYLLKNFEKEFLLIVKEEDKV